MTSIQALWNVVREVRHRFIADDGFPLAGSIAFHTILAVFPFLIILTALAGFIGNAQLAREAVSYLMSVAPNELIEPFVGEIEALLSEPRSDFLSLGILLTLWTASGGINSVRIGLNRAYGLTENRPWYILYAQNILFVVCSAVVTMALALLIVFAPLLIDVVNRLVPALEQVTAYIDQLRIPVAVLVLFAGTCAAHYFLPARWLKWRDLWPGIVFTVAVWLFVAVGYSVYLARFSHFASTYAGLGGLIAGLIFLYLMAAVMLLGGEINRALRFVRSRRDGEADVSALGDETRDKSGHWHRN